MNSSDLHIALSKIDEYLAVHVKELYSLSPDKERITPFIAFHDYIDITISQKNHLFFAEELMKLVAKQVDSFPNNIFWDFDFMTAYLVKKLNDEGVEPLKEYLRLLHDILELFGNKSPINFQYMHDFTYGFDWTRWVKMNPKERKQFGPFDVEFLEYLMKRGGELEHLIREDDKKYGKLEKGEYRNPFTFTREPAAETALFEALAKDDYIPLKLWDMEAVADWKKPYYLVRKSYSKAK